MRDHWHWHCNKFMPFTLLGPADHPVGKSARVSNQDPHEPNLGRVTGPLSERGSCVIYRRCSKAIGIAGDSLVLFLRVRRFVIRSHTPTRRRRVQCHLASHCRGFQPGNYTTTTTTTICGVFDRCTHARTSVGRCPLQISEQSCYSCMPPHRSRHPASSHITVLLHVACSNALRKSGPKRTTEPMSEQVVRDNEFRRPARCETEVG
ncbi:hypothetical protein B0T19DRAFT_182943 [Cercophora scortea]|uniref:Uncharacterized protein n=1 Tax=Cercophora scortea TaxID=314031 RepID=A0AAE0INC3_9PEZI|nr:hypothetical protein B0T19DRAFT_182943 [Cercophora scortea]